MCIFTAIGTAIATSIGLSVAAAGASAAGAAVITSTTAAVIGGVAVAGVAAGIAGTALGAVGSYQQGKAQAAAYSYQAKVAEENRKLALQNAAMERQTGLEEARRQRIATLQAIGKQEVALAANGVDVGYGTSLDLIEDTAMLGELDALTIEYNSEKRARNYDIEAMNFANEANLAQFSARNARTAGTMNAIAGGLKTVGQIGSAAMSLAGGMGSLGEGISWGKTASGATIGQQGNKIYAGLSSGLG